MEVRNRAYSYMEESKNVKHLENERVSNHPRKNEKPNEEEGNCKLRYNKYDHLIRNHEEDRVKEDDCFDPTFTSNCITSIISRKRQN